MAEALSLLVHLADAEVGRLGIDAQQQICFEYAADWRQSGFTLAPSVPLSEEASRETEGLAAAAAFFQNLLPEGQALDDVCRSLQISKSSSFGLLRAMGSEASGAVRVLAPDRPFAADKLRPVPRAELSGRIRDRQDVPFSVWDGTVRLSIAGYQDKLAVFESDGDWALVDGVSRASTHILKPDPIAPRLSGLTSNEFFCMRLAAAIKLPVAPVRLEHVPEPVLVVERFDRARDGDRVRRIHVIDGCQALGVTPGLKYERPFGDGRDVAGIRTGTSLPALFRLGRSATTPAAFKLHLLRWVIFQALIQNFDAHAKNISFFWDRHGLRVAPAYDLVSIGIYPEGWLPKTFAMAFGDAFTVEDLIAYEWAHMAHLCDIKPRQLANEIVKMATAIERAAGGVAAQVVAEGGDPGITQRVRDLVLAMSASQRQLAPEIPKIDRTLFERWRPKAVASFAEQRLSPGPSVHPKPNDKGQAVKLECPSTPTLISAWNDPGALARVIPEGPMPPQLNGVPLTSWNTAPTTVSAWEQLAKRGEIPEPAFKLPAGKKAAAGAVIREPDGRYWIVSPSNAWGGYTATFPKGTLDGLSLQATALKEVFEESGLRVRLISWLMDTPRTLSFTRYYLAERVEGSPADMGWESQAVSLVPVSQLSEVLTSSSDKPLLQRLLKTPRGET